MTTREFLKRRALGQIAPTARVRTIVWRWRPGDIEWEEVFVDGRYETIEVQEMIFRDEMSLATFVTPVPAGPTPTVAARNWRG